MKTVPGAVEPATAPISPILYLRTINPETGQPRPRRVTQGELAHATGLSKNTIINLEHGITESPSEEVISALEKLGVDREAFRADYAAYVAWRQDDARRALRGE